MSMQPSNEPRQAIGVIEWFRPGEHERLERVLADMKRLNLTHLRTGFSWADYYTEAGRRWYDWLLPRLSREVEVLPCFTYTPPSLGIEPKTSSPPRNPKDYADFLDVIITRHGKHFEWVEIWNEPNNLNDWDWRMDTSWSIFCEMAAAAANWARERGKKTVLGGMCPTDPNWLELLAKRGVLDFFDAIGVHGFPGTWEFDWFDWNDPISKVRDILNRHDLNPEIWITEAGYATTKNDEFAQLKAFVDLLQAPAERIYWYSAHDLDSALPHQNGFHVDERHYHFGLYRADGRPKLLPRIWAEDGLAGVRSLADLGRSHAAPLHRDTNVVQTNGHGSNGSAISNVKSNGKIHSEATNDDRRTTHEDGEAGRLTERSGVNDERQPTRERAQQATDGAAVGCGINGHLPGSLSPFRNVALHANGNGSCRHTLITGGAGFIGTNLAARLLENGRCVRIFDSLARPGVEKNLEWLCRQYGDRVEVQLEDIRNPWAIYDAVVKADQVFHFAAQVAVTKSVNDPREDFDINARGTLNLLEALRKLDSPPPLLFTSTNKVYGGLDDVQLSLQGSAYRPVDERYKSGIGIDRPLDFESPYGCSKGAADEYVLDYCRMFGLSTVVFRMSCIYGPHQFGTEDQGWIAHFLMRALRDEPITIYGDGKQVRDILFVDDLIRAMIMSMNEIDDVRGRAFNVGGGTERAVSLLEVLEIIENLHGHLPAVDFSEWRPCDQKFYVSDTSELERATGWQPGVGVHDGIRQLYEWMIEESPVLLPQAVQ